jgi:hypothetical protein
VTARMVTYRVKDGRAEENSAYVREVMADLEARSTEGVTYSVYLLEDGVSFVHVVIEHDVEHADSLQDVPAFEAFVSGIADRCEEPPVASGATVVGGHN